ncbi:hypothetical protein HRbin15_01324 [bacterium HR15]|nr:hypothetical protein HRbin15_01324 [bacterium HR15]
MARIYLQHMVEVIPDENLPANWADFDLASFSKEKTLWDYQQSALRNALKALWKYYEDFGDYQPGEANEVNAKRKEKLWKWYQDNGLQENYDLALSSLNHRIASLLKEHYEANGSKLPYEHFINRMAFWMATGSGKTLVIVKLIEVLARLIQRGEIPPCGILFLTHRDDLIEQLNRHVEEFNRARSDFRIVLRELRDYAAVKRNTPSLYQEQEVTVFYYRSDNLSDEQKERIVNFRNYDNDGRWYVLLDEAHKGDREDSKRQHIYSILSRNGFLFNFSATFTDPRDIATTVFNFNLSEYIRAGYGKHIVILQQEMRAFRDKEDYKDEEKQKIVLKALMMLVYAHKAYELVRSTGGYHRPLMLVLVNSVNTEEADLKLFFEQLERIARGGVGSDLWKSAKDELEQELKQSPAFMFEEENAVLLRNVWDTLQPSDLLRFVFNATAPGEIEVLIRPSDRKELAFKLKTVDRPFALIKIGDISSWLKEKLTGYEIAERFEDESYFARLNAEDSDITILMGSRTFYEGWDSNRPNVICYINIGVGEDARKFILQSVGRGVRIEPVKNKRKRLLPLCNAGEVDRSLFDKLKDSIQPLETLFVFGTNRQALQKVICDLKQEQTRPSEKQLTIFEVNPEAENQTLLIPVYRQSSQPMAELRPIAKFEIDREEFEVLERFVSATDDRVLLALTEKDPRLLRLLRRSLDQPDDFYRFNGRRYGDMRRLLGRVLDYMNMVPEEVDGLKKLEDEIRHFRHITVTLKDISGLQNRAEAVRRYPDRVRELRELYGKVPPEEYEAKAREVGPSGEFFHDGKRIVIKHIAQHYYLPVVLSEDERVDYIRHIIRTPSEVRFVNDLERHLDQSGNRFGEFDWWFFSKLDESLDEVYIPYYDPKTNRTARFKPDFIFWLCKGDKYWIVFVDPKGTEHTDWLRKLEGYRRLFEDSNNQPIAFQHDKFTARIMLLFYTSDRNQLPEDERFYWFDKLEQLVKRVHASVNRRDDNAAPMSQNGCG